MKYLWLAPLLAMGGCVTPPDPASVDQAVSRAVIAEAGTRLRCPRSETQWRVVRGVRMGFDLRYGGLLSVDQSARLAEARRATDEACGV